MKILVVAPQPFYTPRGTPFSVYHRSRTICDLGHDIELLTYGQGADVDIPGLRVVRIPACSWLGPIPIGPSMVKLVLDFLMIPWTIGLLITRRYDVVHAHEEAVFWCRFLKPLFRFRLIYDMHSSLPEQLENFGYSRSKPLRRTFEYLERNAVRAADAVIVVCPALQDLACSMTDDEKVLLIENSLFDEIKLKRERPQSNCDSGDEPQRIENAEDWIASHEQAGFISYAGTLEAYQGIDTLIESFAAVVGNRPNSGLLIIGGQPQEVAKFRGQADGLNLGDTVHFVGQISQGEAQRLVGKSTASISPRKSGTNTPMKIYHLLAAGIPVIATRIESHTQVLNDDVAILCDAGPEGLAEAMLRALDDTEGARTMAQRARDWYQRNYSRDVYTAKTRRLLSLVT